MVGMEKCAIFTAYNNRYQQFINLNNTFLTMKRLMIVAAVAALIAAPADVSAQGWLHSLGQKAAGKAIGKIEEAATKKDKKADKAERQDEPEQRDEQESAAESAAPAKRTAETVYAKTDFVPGDVVIFADDLEGEQLGEFPSQWDLVNGSAEVAKHDGRMCIFLENDNTEIAPLINGDSKNYLPDQFTLEFDYWCNGADDYNAGIHLRLIDAEANNCGDINIATEEFVRWGIQKPREGEVNGEYDALETIERQNAWNHFALSFNKRAMKIYINGTRIANLPNVKAPTAFSISGEFWEDHRCLLAGFRLAQGAVPLYDRVMSEGKIVTYAITFDVAKATIKPESMVEINRIKKLMDEQPSLNFEVQGHCDNTGSAATNNRLSQQRAEAIVLKLVELGVDRSRLSAVGKGSNEPIADNSTNEGRARNRRVEFVKK